MKLDSIISKYITLFEGVKVGTGAINRALKDANGIFQMGFEVEFHTSTHGKENEIPLSEIINNRDQDKYFEDAEINYDKVTEYIYNHLDEFIDRDELEEEFLDDHFASNKNWYEEWLEENGYDDQPEDERPDEDEVKGEIRIELEDEIDEYIDEKIAEIDYDKAINHWIDEDATDFIQTMDWIPNPGYDVDYYGNVLALQEEPSVIADDLQEIVDEPVEYFDQYHQSGTKDLDTWYVEPDASVSGGLEISSPVKPIDESLDDLKKIFDWLYDKDYSTSDETGLHISLSYINGPPVDEMDWVKFAVLMGEDYLLKEFNRVGNDYTASQLQKIKNAINKGDLETVTTWSGYQKLRDELRKNMNKRESTFNISTFKKDGRIEFRIMGNEDYHEKFDEVKNGIGRYVMFLEIAKSPTLYKKQFLTKLGKLFTATKEDTLKASEEQVKNISGSNTLKSWVRTLNSAFGKMDNYDIKSLEIYLDMINLEKQSPDNKRDLHRRITNRFFSIIDALSKNAIPILQTSISSLVNESTTFIGFLIEAKETSRFDFMKKIATKLAKIGGITDKDIIQRFGTPEEIVQKINPIENNLTTNLAVPLLILPQTEELLKQKITQNKPVYKLKNKLSSDQMKSLFNEIIDFINGNDLPVFYMVAMLRNFIYFIQDDKIKNDPSMKQIIKQAITNVEKKGGNILQELERNSASLDNREEAIAYAYALMGRQHPNVNQQQNTQQAQQNRQQPTPQS